MTKFMLKSVYAEMDGKPVPILVDLGYIIKDEKVIGATEQRYRALIASGFTKKHFSIEGNGRLFVCVPPSKAEEFYRQFPIEVGQTYWRCTHHWRGLKSGEKIARVPVHRRDGMMANPGDS